MKNCVNLISNYVAVFKGAGKERGRANKQMDRQTDQDIGKKGTHTHTHTHTGTCTRAHVQNPTNASVYSI